MKKSIKTSLLLILFFSIFLGFSQLKKTKRVVGNGNITTKTITTETYDIINGTGAIDIYLERGREGRLTITTDDNLHEYLDIRSIGNVLIVKVKANIKLKTKKGIHITIPFEDLSKIALTGSGDIQSKDIITANHFNISVVGSGNITLPIEASEIKTKITGSGDITLSGVTSNLKVNIAGSSNFRGFDINSQNTSVSISGSGDAKVIATESLTARISGSGDIVYKGNPEKRNMNTAGSGKISSYRY